MSHIIRYDAGKKLKSIFELFIKLKIGFKFVLFSMVQTLLIFIPITLISSLHIPFVFEASSYEDYKKFSENSHMKKLKPIW